MSCDRREFLRMMGISAAALGLSGLSLGRHLLAPGELEAREFALRPEALRAERWGIALRMERFFSQPELYDACIRACHEVHNVPDFGNPKDEIKWIWKEEFEHAFPGQQNPYLPQEIAHRPFLLLCNHCDNPPCVRVCPTKATFKRPDGAVVVDFHRCIGCRFCMAACPYGARSFNWRNPRPFIRKQNPEFPTRMIGVVEKCNLCVERLAKGLRPACVEASGGAMVFGDLAQGDSEIRQLLREHFSIRRKPELGTQPSVFYIIGG
jgi:molybdopterin-containing oxidoreductase family iron-sulfur binding subunit